MREAGEDVGDPQQHAFTESDEHQTVYCSVHRLDHVSPDSLPVCAEQAVAQAQEVSAEQRAVSKQEKQSEKGEAEGDQSVNDLRAVSPGRCCQGARAEAP